MDTAKSNVELMAPAAAAAEPGRAPSVPAARAGLGSAVVFLLLLALLHLVKPELDPSWRFISEYAIGDHGWLMAVAFWTLALSCASLAAALWRQVRSLGGRIGLGLLLLTALGMAIAGLFPTDPITTRREALSASGQLHELGALLDATPFAALLINWSLARHSPAWAPVRRALYWTAGLPLLGLAAFMGSVMVLLPSDGAFGPGVPVGWPNRLLMLSYCAWLVTLSWQALRLGRPRR